jgi:hypothetical protein
MIPLRRASALLSLTFFLAFVAAAQQGTVYTATVIPAVAQSGGTTKVRIQITSWTTAAERTELKLVSWANHALRPEDCFVRCSRTARAPCTNSLRK